MRASLDATAQALQALQASTHTLHAHSDQAQAQRMVDALLSLSVTYRQLIMPLVRAVESRVGADAKMHQEVERLEGMIDNLRGAPPAAAAAVADRDCGPRRAGRVRRRPWRAARSARPNHYPA